VDIDERDWITVGFFWMVTGLIATLPAIAATWLGILARIVFDLAVAAHIAEAVYARMLAERARLDPSLWMRRTLVLGYFGIRKLQKICAKAT
jgi:Transmembrane protein 254